MVTASADQLSTSLRVARAVGTWGGEYFVIAKAMAKPGDMWVVIATRTDRAMAHVQTAINLKESDPDRAYQHLRHAQGLPNPPMQAFFQEAMFQFGGGNIEGAVAATRRGLADVESPTNYSVGRVMALLVASLVKLGRRDEADAELVAAIEERPEQPQLGNMLKSLRAAARARAQASDLGPSLLAAQATPRAKPGR